MELPWTHLQAVASVLRKQGKRQHPQALGHRRQGHLWSNQGSCELPQGPSYLLQFCLHSSVQEMHVDLLGFAPGLNETEINDSKGSGNGPSRKLKSVGVSVLKGSPPSHPTRETESGQTRLIDGVSESQFLAAAMPYPRGIQMCTLGPRPLPKPSQPHFCVIGRLLLSPAPKCTTRHSSAPSSVSEFCSVRMVNV